MIFFLVYTSSQFSAAAKLFSTVFGLNYTTGLTLGAAIIVSYTALGGFAAVCWTDAIQGAIMFFALMAVPFMALYEIGGVSEVSSRLAAITPESLGFFPMLNVPSRLVALLPQACLVGKMDSSERSESESLKGTLKRADVR